MNNKAKIQSFIRSLSDEEISSQIADLFAFMEEYKQLLIEEQNIRAVDEPSNFSEQPTRSDISQEKMSQEEKDYVLPEISLDYNVLTAIQNKVSNFTEEELLENMKELDEVLSNGPFAMPTRAFDEYRAAREACELRYFDDYQCEPIMCENCGAYLVPDQMFCGKCGSSVLKDKI